MLRRTFCQSILALFSLPLVGYTNEPEDEIVSASINTSFNLEPIFTQGDVRIYPDINNKPIIDIVLTYKNGKIEKYIGESQTWVVKSEFGKYDNVTSCKLTKTDYGTRLSIATEDCYCLITGLKPV